MHSSFILCWFEWSCYPRCLWKAEQKARCYQRNCSPVENHLTDSNSVHEKCIVSMQRCLWSRGLENISPESSSSSSPANRNWFLQVNGLFFKPKCLESPISDLDSLITKVIHILVINLPISHMVLLWVKLNLTFWLDNTNCLKLKSWWTLGDHSILLLISDRLKVLSLRNR